MLGPYSRHYLSNSITVIRLQISIMNFLLYRNFGGTILKDIGQQVKVTLMEQCTLLFKD